MIFEKSVYLIVGCQRSGSTMLESVLNAHPSVRVIGEENGAAYQYFLDPKKLLELPEKCICLRIPAATHLVKHAVEKFAGARVLFTLRDPRDVVASMRKLEVRTRPDRPPGKWLVLCAQDEIRNCLTNLPDRERLEETLRSIYEKTADPADIRFGAYCWMLKNRFIPLYQHSPLPTALVRYEILTAHPEPYLKQLIEFLHLDWSDRLMEHEKHSSGHWGGTDKGAAIHQRSVEAYKSSLTLDERRALHSVIRTDMEALGYMELFD